MEDKPRISVIIPVYNGEKTLNMCLNSVLNQTYKNYEVIVVDNDSTDRTKEIIYDLKENSDRIKYVFATRRSSGVARNAGIRKACGDIFVFTDADCICPDKWIEEITWPIRFENEDVVVGFEEDLINNYWTRNIQRRDQLYMQRCSNGKYTMVFDGKNSAIRARLIKELMFDPNISMTDDLGLAVRITLKTRIRYLPSVRVGHFHRSSLKSTIKTYFVRAFWSFRTYRKYKNAGRDIRFESMQPGNWALFPFWMMFQFIKRPASEAYFILVAELSWRTGLLWSIIRSAII